MTPREIDALVAEKVFGWKKITVTNDYGMFRDGWETPAGTIPDYLLPDFSSKIADAWLIVEEFRTGCKFHSKAAACIELSITDYPCDKDCFCEIYSPNIASVVEEAEEMPMAICLAALRAVG